MNELISIESSDLRAEISLMGAELKSLCRHGENNVIWHVDETFWNRSAPILFPIVGRLKNNTYEWKTLKYSMLQHGFARNQKFDVVEKKNSFLKLRLQNNPETSVQYPFQFIFEVIYELKERHLTTIFSVQNSGDETLPFSIGGHPGFQLKGNLENYKLRFTQKFTAYRHLIEDGLYSGEKEKMDVDRNLLLKNELFENDAIVFKYPQFNEVTLCQSVKPIVTLRCADWSAVGFWTKKNAPFFCIEPWWGWADDTDTSGKLTDKKGLIWLEAGKRKEFQFDIEVH